MRRAIPAALLLIAVAALILLLRPPTLWSGGAGAGPRAASPTDPPPPGTESAARRPRSAGVLVLDADGLPAPGTVVDLIPPAVPDAAPVLIGTSDAEGRVAWPSRELPFPGLVRALHPERGGGESLAVSNSEDCTVRLLRPLTLRGMVVAADGAPVGGAEVEARFEPALRAFGPVVGTSGAWVVRGDSAEDGTFALRGLPPPDSVLLTARKSGSIDGQAIWRAQDGGEPRVVMHRTFRALVRVEDQEGKPVDGAAVFVTGAGRVEFDDGITKPAVLALPSTGPGEYSRDDLAPGWYLLIVAKPGFEIELDLAAALHADRGPVHVVLLPAEGVEGRVVDSDTGEPIESATISVIPFGRKPPRMGQWAWAPFAAGAGEALEARTDATGRFRIAIAGPESPVGLSARAEGFHPKGGQLRELLRDDRVPIQMDRSGSFALSGRAVTQERSPIEGALVVWDGGRAATGVDGAFRVEEFREGLVTLFAPGFRQGERTVVEDGDLGDVVLSRLRTLRGAVVQEDGSPVPGVEVSAFFQGVGTELFGREGTPGVSDDAGGVALLAPEEPGLAVAPLGGHWLGQTPVPATGPGNFRLVVTANPAAAGGSIQGTLVLPEGGPPEKQGWVVAIPEEAQAGSKAPVFEADPVGRFVASGLRAGRWTLKASTTDGYRGEIPGVVLEPGGALEVELRLERAPPTTEPPVLVDVDVRPVPAAPPEEAHRLRAWATSWKASRSAEARRSKDGALRVAAKADERFSIWAYDFEGKRAGVAGVDAPSAADPVEVHLVAAGWIVLPPDPKAVDRWVVLRDARETPIYSGFEGVLPAVPGEGHHLVVPPGAWSLTISRGLARRDPRVVRVTVAPGSGTRAE